MHQAYKDTYVGIAGTLKESKFLQEGVLTPEEFVAAGDLLVFKCPSWSWAAGDPGRAESFLPREKQFLITRKVPCVDSYVGSSKSTEGEDGWLALEAAQALVEDQDVPEMDVQPKPGEAAEAALAAEGDDDDGDVPDMEGFEEENLLEGDAAAAQPPAPSQGGPTTTANTRCYDVALTYDAYYHTPKVWLLGYAASGQPLTGPEMMADVSADHAGKTITLAPQPHLGVGGGSWLWIHPCRHAAVMKKFVARQAVAGKDPRIDLYFLLFLKFLGAILPTIQYDNTFDVDL